MARIVPGMRELLFGADAGGSGRDVKTAVAGFDDFCGSLAGRLVLDRYIPDLASAEPCRQARDGALRADRRDICAAAPCVGACGD